MRDTIRFLLGDEPVVVARGDPCRTLLQYLREDAALCGTKEGCAEGDCGACTILLGQTGRDGGITYRPVNACILLLPMVDEKQVVTVEHLAAIAGGVHAVQQAMADENASQCGFCTPGFTVAVAAHQISGGGRDRRDIDDALAGNLCRCTGYGPIIAAARKAASQPVSAEWRDFANRAQGQLSAWAGAGIGLDVNAGDSRFIAPRDLGGLRAALAENPDATIVAGATDVGLWVTKGMRRLEVVIHLGRIAALQNIEEGEDTIEIGAAVTYADAHDALAAIAQDLGELVRRLGATQVRATGTICGNIANGSPIGDMPPALIALGAELVLDGAAGERTMPLEDFFIEYGKQDREPGEFVRAVRVPRHPRGEFRCYKISKRFDQDITACLGAFDIAVQGGVVSRARIAFGGMAAIPKRAHGAEAAIIGAPWNRETVEAAKAALAEDFTPMTDMRASAAYRLKVAQNLIEKAWLETGGAPANSWLRLTDRRQPAEARADV